MKRLTLSAEWGGYPAGAELDILATGEEPRERAVDPRRAALLVRNCIAAETPEPLVSVVPDDEPKPKQARARAGKGKHADA
jgi:hypothetical protein